MNPLENLNDIAEPSGVSFLPLAWGWWFVIAVIVMLVLCAAIGIVRYYRRHAARKATCKLLDHQFQQNTLSLSSANTLLKRVCMTYSAREAVAAMHGEQWVNTLKNCLHQKAKNHPNTEKLTIFKQTQYLPDQENNKTLSQREIYDVTGHWLRKVDLTYLAKLKEKKGQHV
jgi:hypothetical protein